MGMIMYLQLFVPIAIPDGTESPLAPLLVHDSVEPEMEHAETESSPKFATNKFDGNGGLGDGLGGGDRVVGIGYLELVQYRVGILENHVGDLG